MRIEHTLSWRVALTLIGVTVAAFIAIHLLGESSGAASALSVVAGLCTMAALDFLSRASVPAESELANFDLNREFAITAIAASMPHPLADPEQAIGDDKPGAITAKQLLSTDPTLALAKLRIDLEQALVELAIDNHRENRSLFHIAEGLVHTGKLPMSLLYPIKQISDICNGALHGAQLAPSKAAEVVEVGETLLAALGNLRTTASDVAEAN